MVGREKSHERVGEISERECSWLVVAERSDWSLDACDIVGRRKAENNKYVMMLYLHLLKFDYPSAKRAHERHDWPLGICLLGFYLSVVYVLVR